MKSYLKALINPELPEDIGNVHAEWSFPEFIQHRPSKWWYLGTGAVLVAMLIYAVVTANFLFAIILVLAAFVTVYQFFQTPRGLQVKIGQDGVIVDRRFYPYRDLQSFWIIYEPPVAKLLYLDFKNKFRKSLPVPLEESNPLQVREALLNYLEENFEEEDERLDETIGRMLKMR
ncbi:MAG: hypothetical protein V1763_00380 [Parcubacteria group bacterium]